MIQQGDAVQFQLTAINANTSEAFPIPSDSGVLKSILLLAPDGDIIEKDALFITDGADGGIYCDIAEGELDIVGKWCLQILFHLVAGHLHSKKYFFYVGSNIR